MSELTQPAPGGAPAAAVPGRDAFVRALSLRLSLTWEAAAYAVVFVSAFALRFWDLGSRALHHDESLHGYFSYQLFLGHGYEHDPALHGPFQYFGTALAFLLTGGSGDYSVRVFPALFGVALVAMPLLFRSHLGRWGALAAAALIALSPTLLYFSRFAREDIYAAVFTLGLVICVWRYVAEGRVRYLAGAGLLLGLSFATKSNAFITAALFFLFLNFWAALDLSSQSREAMRPGWRRSLAAAAYFPFAWLAVALWPFTPGLRDRLGLRNRTVAMDILLVLGTLAGPQFAAASKLPLEALGLSLDSVSANRALGFPVVIALLAASAAVGLRWNARVWLIAAAAFYVPYVLLYTSFFTNLAGFGSGIWGSLDYWLSQHGAARGDQPEFYYLMFLPMYEFLVLALAGPALIYHCLRGGPRSWLLTAVAVMALLAVFGADSFTGTIAGIDTAVLAGVLFLPVAALALFFALRGPMFERFLVFWAAGTIVAYSYVGERMPWLSVHTTLPLLVLAAYTGGKVFASLGLEPRDRPRLRVPAPPTALAVAAAACAGLAVGLLVFGPSEGGWRVLAFAGIVFAAVGLAAALLLADRRHIAAISVAAVLGVFAVFSVRTAVVATFEHGDVAREFLVYTQTHADVPELRDEIDRLAVATGLGSDLRVQVESDHTWPWAWYLRDYDISFHPVADEGIQPQDDAIVLIAAADEAEMAPFQDDYLPPQPYVFQNWFPEDYRTAGDKPHLAAGLRDFFRDLARPAAWERWWDYFLHRDVQPQRILCLAYIPLEFERLAGFAPVLPPPVDGEPPVTGPQPDLEGRLIIGRLGDRVGEMQHPVNIAVAPDGSIYVADAGNNRIQRFDVRGRLSGIIEGSGEEEGSVRFAQPSDVALGPDGRIYVADTWNHRIVVFTLDLAFAGAFGQATRDLVNPGPDEMWGPRGVAVDPEGNVWVTDTGTHRVRKFTPDGTAIGSFGERGRGPGQFMEPVGIAIGTDGSVYVADTENARIQVFDSGFGFVAEWEVDGWQTGDPRNKPYLAALPDGRVITTDGPHGSLLLIARNGQTQSRLDTAGDVPLFFPAGVALDSARDFVYVTDAAAGHVRRFPIRDFAR